MPKKFMSDPMMPKFQIPDTRSKGDVKELKKRQPGYKGGNPPSNVGTKVSTRGGRS